MLILTRRPGERVVIGDEILVTVMGVSGHTVRLGIAAPQGVPIYREEIWLAVKEENRAAAEATADALPAEPPKASPQDAQKTAAEDPPESSAETPADSSPPSS
ncbi:MAG TPA: carbon storage regulator CsrA [Solirubrobacteraceae bacterium]|jgi:carbon storage regulator|nr:carbon storage regulator CsrA [Solirubrobacteraceae bacterium]